MLIKQCSFLIVIYAKGVPKKQTNKLTIRGKNTIKHYLKWQQNMSKNIRESLYKGTPCKLHYKHPVNCKHTSSFWQDNFSILKPNNWTLL